MAESIRSLTVKLGYDIDTTGADIFKSRFNRLKTALNKGKDGLKRKKISLRDLFKFRKADFDAWEKGFNRRLNRAGAGIRKNAKKVLAGIAVAIAAGIAAATKIFTGFASVEQARGSLEFRAGDQFDDTIKSIEKARKETGNLVSELDALNAFNLGADIIGDFKFLSKHFSTVIKLSKVLGKDVGEVQQAFANFVATGSNLQELVKFGFFTPEQLDALKKASTDFSQQGLETRKALLSAKIEEGKPALEESFAKFQTKSQATIDKLATVTEDTVKVLGERLNPAINNVATGLTDAIGRAKKKMEEGGGFFGVIKSIFTSSKKEEAKKIESKPITPSTLSMQSTTIAPNDNSTTTNIININGTNKEPGTIAREVEGALAKKIIQSSSRREIPQSLNTTIQPAESK